MIKKFLAQSEKIVNDCGKETDFCRYLSRLLDLRGRPKARKNEIVSEIRYSFVDKLTSFHYISLYIIIMDRDQRVVLHRF